MTRPLRALFLASDGRSGGHVARALAIARALERTSPGGGPSPQALLATTSRADGLLRAGGVPFVRLPGPQDGGSWPEVDRRHLVASTLEGLVEGFSPDVLVTDTFPSGPHLEAASLLRRVPFRVLVRRAIRPERAADAEALAGLADYHLALVPADPIAPAETLRALACAGVPPITLVEGGDLLSREEARRALGLGEGRWVLVSTGAGGDPEAAALGNAIAGRLAVLGLHPFLAGLPELLPGGTAPPFLGRYLRAFDAAIAAAGYNTSHELALAGVPTLLFARPRPYDDQEARARRFDAAGLARFLPSLQEGALAAALDGLTAFRPARLEGGGAAAAARELTALVASGSPARSVPA